MASIASPAWRTSRASSWSSSPVSPGSRTASAPWQIATILCLWGLVIGAVYMLRAYRNIFQGDLSKAAAYATELLPAERAANYFLVITLVVFGFLPDLVLQFFS